MTRRRIRTPAGQRGTGRQAPAPRPPWDDPPDLPAIVARCRGRRILAVMRDGSLWTRGEAGRFGITRSWNGIPAAPMAWCPLHGYKHKIDQAKVSAVLSASDPGRVTTVDIDRLC